MTARYLMLTVIVMGMMNCLAMPSEKEFATARAVVADVMEPELAAMKDGKKKPCEVADFALSLMGESETAAAKYLLAGRAYALYVKGGDYAKAAKAMDELQGVIPDMPCDRLLKDITPALRGVPEKKAPELYVRLAELKGMVRSQSEITKLKSALAKAKASEKPDLYRRMGENYAVVNDWKNALEYFVKAGGKVAEIAQSELDGAPADAKIAGFWWDQSEEKGLAKSVASAYRAHAAELYRKGLDAGTISGLNKRVAEQRIEAGAKTIPQVPAKAQDKKLYCVIDLSRGPNASRYPVSYLADVPKGGWTDAYKTTKLVLRRIEPGTCVVTVDKPYYIGVFEVTQKQYQLITGTTPSHFAGNDKRPVEQVSYDMIRGSNKGAQYPGSTDVDDDSCVGKLRKRTGLHFDLPTEAQWEYACRAGTATVYSYGDSVNGDYMWYNANSGRRTQDVGARQPNRWGFYDMHGNVWEWCLEWYSSSGARRIQRCGSWDDDAGNCTSFARGGCHSSGVYDNLGFRLVVPLSD